MYSKVGLITGMIGLILGVAVTIYGMIAGILFALQQM